LAELVDLAEAHNPETRVAWERARAQAAALGVARSELYPTLAAAVVSEKSRSNVLFGNEFFPQTIQDFEVGLDLNYTVFDIGARSGRINAAKAELGMPVAELIRRVGISEQTFYRWKKQYSNLEVDQVRQLKQLQDENGRLKKLVAELTLDRAMLQDVLRKNW
jgi:outer membrane protein TolC